MDCWGGKGRGSVEWGGGGGEGNTVATTLRSAYIDHQQHRRQQQQQLQQRRRGRRRWRRSKTTTATVSLDVDACSQKFSSSSLPAFPHNFQLPLFWGTLNFLWRIDQTVSLGSNLKFFSRDGASLGALNLLCLGQLESNIQNALADTSLIQSDIQPLPDK